MKLTQTVAPILDLQMLLDHSLLLKQQIEDMDSERKETNAAIQAELHAAGVETMQVGEHKVSLVVIEGRQNIDKMRLLEAGVTSAQILAATTQGSGYSRLDIRKAGKK